MLLKHLLTRQTNEIFSKFTPTIYAASHSNLSILLKLLNRLNETLSSKKCLMFTSIDVIFIVLFQFQTDETKNLKFQHKGRWPFECLCTMHLSFARIYENAQFSATLKSNWGKVVLLIWKIWLNCRKNEITRNPNQGKSEKGLHFCKTHLLYGIKLMLLIYFIL